MKLVRSLSDLRQLVGVKCPYCNKQSALVSGRELYPRRTDLFNLKFWHCKPCDAYVGCHLPGIWVPEINSFSDGTIPFGRLANKELRQFKSSAHDIFDPLWQLKYFSDRKAAYAWLAESMCLGENECHIGKFDIPQCKQVIALCFKFLEVKNEEAEC